MSETMTLLATIFEKCTGSNLCESFKGDVSGTTDNIVAVSNTANDLLEQTIADNEVLIAELVAKSDAIDVRRLELAEEAERTGVIEESYRVLEREYRELVEEADATTARNVRISNALRETHEADVSNDTLIAGLRTQIEELTVLIGEKESMITAKVVRITTLSGEVNVLTAHSDDKDILIEERNATIEEMTATITEYTSRFNELKEIHEELALKYHVLTHTHHSASSVEIIVPGLTYKPDIAEYVRLYGFPEDFEFDDVKLDAIRWNLCEDGGGM